MNIKTETKKVITLTNEEVSALKTTKRLISDMINAIDDNNFLGIITKEGRQIDCDTLTENYFVLDVLYSSDYSYDCYKE